MSVGSEFHRSDAATGKERRPTVVSRNGDQRPKNSLSLLCVHRTSSLRMSFELTTIFLLYKPLYR